MALNVEMVTFDCSDPAALAAWWAEQFEGTTQEMGMGAGAPARGWMRIGVRVAR